MIVISVDTTRKTHTKITFTRDKSIPYYYEASNQGVIDTIRAVFYSLTNKVIYEPYLTNSETGRRQKFVIDVIEPVQLTDETKAWLSRQLWRQTTYDYIPYESPSVLTTTPNLLEGL